MISFFALYYGVIFENGDKLALNGVFMGNACVFLVAFRLLKTQSF
ncbi:membrane protein [Helicobacter pylori FD662]|nr:membrane protein [Helicobacter pylori FD662]